jgi:hypothetical protein
LSLPWIGACVGVGEGRREEDEERAEDEGSEVGEG